MQEIVSMDEKVCPDCGGVEGECICCLGCGHICPLDSGELFCPICKPEPEK